MRRVRAPIALALAAAAATTARAQTVEFYSLTGDSVLTVLTGDTGAVQLWVTGLAGQGVSAYDIDIALDDARVTLAKADSVDGYGLPSPTITAGAGSVNIAASGTGAAFFTMQLATLYFELNASAVEGSLLSLKVNSLTSGDGLATDLVPNHRTGVLDVCQAEQVWGDLDANRAVNSRDALVAITHAVGLTVSGFDLDLGDVDEDLQVTTRDALLILSEGIGLWTGTRAGVPKANRCSPLSAMPNDMAVWLSTTLGYVAAGDTTVQSVGVTGQSSYHPSWAPDGTKLVFTEYIGTPFYSYDFVTTTLDGSVVDTLFVSTAADYSPAWSPDGTRIAFVRGSDLYVMNADGSNQVLLADTDSLAVEASSRVEWSPDGSKLVFTGYPPSACCTDVVWTVNADGTGLTKVTSVFAYDPTWSPAGDSLAYDYSGVSRIYWIQAAGDTSLIGAPVSRLAGGQDHPGWVPAGPMFQSTWDFPYEFYLERPSDGRLLRLTRGIQSATHAALRRVGAYVDTVSVSPTTASLSVLGTQQLTVTVVDNGGSPITPGSGITWSSSDETVATVDQTGLVTAVGVGTATITASAGGWRSGTASVTVNP